jgi:hypothetical protein
MYVKIRFTLNIFICLFIQVLMFTSVYAGLVDLDALNEKGNRLIRDCHSGSIESCNELGDYLSSPMLKKYNRSLHYYIKSCILNDGHACNRIGYLYNQHLENKIDSKLYYKLSCDVDFAFGCFNLATLQKSKKMKLHYLTKACRLNQKVFKGCKKIESKNFVERFLPALPNDYKKTLKDLNLNKKVSFLFKIYPLDRTAVRKESDVIKELKKIIFYKFEKIDKEMLKMHLKKIEDNSPLLRTYSKDRIFLKILQVALINNSTDVFQKVTDKFEDCIVYKVKDLGMQNFNKYKNCLISRNEIEDYYNKVELYANGWGVTRDTGTAIRLALEKGGVYSELEMILENLYFTRFQKNLKKDFLGCDNVTSGLSMGICQSEVSYVKERLRVQTLKASLDEKFKPIQVKSYLELYSTYSKYIRSHSGLYNYYHGGTSAGARTLYDTSRYLDAFIIENELVSSSDLRRNLSLKEAIKKYNSILSWMLSSLKNSEYGLYTYNSFDEVDKNWKTYLSRALRYYQEFYSHKDQNKLKAYFYLQRSSELTKVVLSSDRINFVYPPTFDCEKKLMNYDEETICNNFELSYWDHELSKLYIRAVKKNMLSPRIQKKWTEELKNLGEQDKDFNMKQIYYNRILYLKKNK